MSGALCTIEFNCMVASNRSWPSKVKKKVCMCMYMYVYIYTHVCVKEYVCLWSMICFLYVDK